MRYALMTTLLALAASCSRFPDEVPVPWNSDYEAGTGNVEQETGLLLVRTERSMLGSNGLHHLAHLPYAIYSAAGTLVQKVYNNTSSGRPVRVDLPPGRYLIRAQRVSKPPIDIAVTIEPGRLTEVDVKSFTP